MMVFVIHGMQTLVCGVHSWRIRVRTCPSKVVLVGLLWVLLQNHDMHRQRFHLSMRLFWNSLMPSLGLQMAVPASIKKF